MLYIIWSFIDTGLEKYLDTHHKVLENSRVVSCTTKYPPTLNNFRQLSHKNLLAYSRTWASFVVGHVGLRLALKTCCCTWAAYMRAKLCRDSALSRLQLATRDNDVVLHQITLLELGKSGKDMRNVLDKGCIQPSPQGESIPFKGKRQSHIGSIQGQDADLKCG